MTFFAYKTHILHVFTKKINLMSEAIHKEFNCLFLFVNNVPWENVSYNPVATC